jgi:hypothetical protein
MKKMKLSRASKAAIVAFEGLHPEDELHVLRELGLMRDPTATAAAGSRAAERDRKAMSAAISDFDLAWLQPAPGEQSIGLPCPTQMTDEQRAIHYPPRVVIDDSRLQAKIAAADARRDAGKNASHPAPLEERPPRHRRTPSRGPGRLA